MSAHTPWAIYDQNGKLIRGGFKSKRDALQSLPPCNRRWYKALQQPTCPRCASPEDRERNTCLACGGAA